MKGFRVLVVGVILAVATTAGVAQTEHPRIEQSHSLKADSISGKAQEGISKEQADEIIKELKAIHQVLDRQQATTLQQPQATVTSDKVQMNVEAGWYSLGRDDAPVTVVEFADYQCPFCRKFHSETFAALKKNYIDAGKVRFVSRDLPLDFHPSAPGAALAARCAGEQNKYWEMRDMMLSSNLDLTSARLLEYGRQINLDVSAFKACLDGKKFDAAIQKDVADAGTLGIRGTPGFVVGNIANHQITGVRIAGAVPYSVFETAIENRLTSKP
jgi:protein-disulfide isomerase